MTIKQTFSKTGLQVLVFLGLAIGTASLLLLAASLETAVTPEVELGRAVIGLCGFFFGIWLSAAATIALKKEARRERD